MADASESLPYVPLAEFTNTLPTGGDSLTENLNVYYEVRNTTF